MKRILLIFLIVSSAASFAQSIHEPLYNNDIYDFLDNQASKGNIGLFDDVRPYTRILISEKLLELKGKRVALTNSENKQLDFFLSEYAFEKMFLKKDSTKV